MTEKVITLLAIAVIVLLGVVVVVYDFGWDAGYAKGLDDAIDSKPDREGEI